MSQWGSVEPGAEGRASFITHLKGSKGFAGLQGLEAKKVSSERMGKKMTSSLTPKGEHKRMAKLEVPFLIPGYSDAYATENTKNTRLLYKIIYISTYLLERDCMSVLIFKRNFCESGISPIKCLTIP